MPEPRIGAVVSRGDGAVLDIVLNGSTDVNVSRGESGCWSPRGPRTDILGPGLPVARAARPAPAPHRHLRGARGPAADALRGGGAEEADAGAPEAARRGLQPLRAAQPGPRSRRSAQGRRGDQRPDAAGALEAGHGGGRGRGSERRPAAQAPRRFLRRAGSDAARARTGGRWRRRAPGLDLRRVAKQARRHHYGRDVLVGIIDVGGFDFAHEDFADGGGTRWVAIWDQGGTDRPSPADGRDGGRFASLDYGSEIRKATWTRAIAAAAARNMAGDEPRAAVGDGGRVARHPRRLDRGRQPRRRPAAPTSPAC